MKAEKVMVHPLEVTPEKQKQRVAFASLIWQQRLCSGSKVEQSESAASCVRRVARVFHPGATLPERDIPIFSRRIDKALRPYDRKVRRKKSISEEQYGNVDTALQEVFSRSVLPNRMLSALWRKVLHS